jgi:hypothetical protein
MKYLFVLIVITIGCQLPSRKTNDEEIREIISEMHAITHGEDLEEQNDDWPELKRFVLIMDCSVRSKASMHSEKIGTFKKGQAILGQELGDWVLINYEHQEMSYISKSCLK